MCENSGSQTIVFKIKHSDGKLFTQSGDILKISNISADQLSLKTDYSTFSEIIDYRTDNNLELAAPACARELK